MSGRLLEEQCPRLAHPHRRFISDACIAGESSERGKASSNIVLLFLYLICAGPDKDFLNISREAPHHGGNIAIQNRDMPCEKRAQALFVHFQMLGGVGVPYSQQALPDERRLREKFERSIAQIESRLASELHGDYALCWKISQRQPVWYIIHSCGIGTGGGDQAGEPQCGWAKVYLNRFCLESVRAEAVPKIPAIQQRNPQRADLLPMQGEIFNLLLYSLQWRNGKWFGAS